VIETVGRGEIHIEEPGLKTIVRAAIGSGHLSTATAAAPADVFIIAVPTPITPDKHADMAFVVGAAEAVVPHLRPGNLVILESTSPPGTCAELVRPILDGPLSGPLS
jgi:UDP-N-acetyl-D-mannosaminuronic acid dehydrogenase